MAAGPVSGRSPELNPFFVFQHPLQKRVQPLQKVLGGAWHKTFRRITARFKGFPCRTGVKPFPPPDKNYPHRRFLSGKPARTETMQLHNPVFPVPAVPAASLGFERSACNPLRPGTRQEPVLGVTPPEKHLLEEKFSEVADKRAVMRGVGRRGSDCRNLTRRNQSECGAHNANYLHYVPGCNLFGA
jgi:hypothetical protein